MKKVLKKIGNFFATFIFPRKMANYTRMSLFFGFLLFICCLMISFSSSNMQAKEYVIDLYGDKFFIDNSTHKYKLSEGSTDLPKLELVTDTSGNYQYAICENLPVENGNPKYEFDYVLNDTKDNKSKLLLKVVYELDYYEDEIVENPKIPTDLQGTYLIYEGTTRHIIEVINDGKGYYDGKNTNFEYSIGTNNEKIIKSETEKLSIEIKLDSDNSYQASVKVENSQLTIDSVERLFSTNTLKHFDFYNYLTAEPTLNKDENELLIIFTKTLVYSVYNRGRTSLDDQENFNYLETTDSKGNPTHYIYKYYLPEGDEGKNDLSDPTTWTKESSYGKKTEINGVEYTAYPKELLSSLAEIFAYNTPVISYAYAESAKVDVLNVKADVLVSSLTSYLIDSWASSAKYQTSCAAGFPFGFILPLLCVCITWLMSKKKGVLKTFKEYFNLAALTYVLPAVICFILGFFVQYTQFVYFTLLFQLGFFIIAAYRINTLPQDAYGTSTKTYINGQESSNGTLTIDSNTTEEIVEETNETNDENNDDTTNLIG